MQDYLVIALRSKFTLFYRFGEMIVPQGEFISFSGEIDKPEIAEKVLDALKETTFIEYDSEALILHLRSTKREEDKSLKFELSNLEAIYPFTEHARTSISENIDSRIVLSQPIFGAVWDAYEDWRLKKLHFKGADILCRLCKLEYTAEYYLDQIGLDSLYEGLISRGSYAKLKSENYWAHLMAYDRHEYFPKETIGYFYDAGEAYAHSAGKDTFVGSGLYRFLESLSSIGLRFSDILDQLAQSELTQSYINKTSSRNALKWYEIAPLFFQLKEDFLKVGRELPKSILIKYTEKLKKEFPDSFPFVVALLGLFWGYHHLYDTYYDSLNLPFYNQSSNDLTKIKHGISEDVGQSAIAPEFHEKIIASIKGASKQKLGIKTIKKLCIEDGVDFERYKKQLENDQRVRAEKQSYVFNTEASIDNEGFEKRVPLDNERTCCSELFSDDQYDPS